ncbi:MAG TPA: fluoride efflux transporter CrcB [Solirubrobacteraceae bacterium]|nr:fluoride efflux transporter CrcB [Solirubrobacteraceae bacterium]
MRADRPALVAVFAGGFAGAIARAVLLDALPADAGQWPWATFLANVAGALLLGWVVARVPPHAHGRPLLATGFCGALTTFSTLQLELLQMLDGEHVALAAAYSAASIGVGLLAIGLGAGAGRRRRVAS